MEYFVQIRTDKHLISVDKAGRYSALPEGDAARAELTIGLKISAHPGYRRINHATIERTALTISIVVIGKKN